MITHSAGDIEDYALLHHAPSISVHMCRANDPERPWRLWKHRSKFAGLAGFELGSVRAVKVTDTFTLVSLACFEGDELNEEAARSGLTIVLNRARTLNAMVYLQYRTRSMPDTLREFISGFAGAVVCLLSKVDNKARQNE